MKTYQAAQDHVSDANGKEQEKERLRDETETWDIGGKNNAISPIPPCYKMTRTPRCLPGNPQASITKDA